MNPTTPRVSSTSTSSHQNNNNSSSGGGNQNAALPHHHTTASTSSSSSTGGSASSLATLNRNRQYTHLHAQLAQLNAQMADMENLVGMTAVQAEYIRGLGAWWGGSFMAASKVLGEEETSNPRAGGTAQSSGTAPTTATSGVKDSGI